MTKLNEWIKRERELSENATAGPWKPLSLIPTIIKKDYDGSITCSMDDGHYIANVRTGHDKALRVIEELHSCVQKLYAMPSDKNYNWVSIEAEKVLENIETIIEAPDKEGSQ